MSYPPPEGYPFQELLDRYLPPFVFCGIILTIVVLVYLGLRLKYPAIFNQPVIFKKE